MMDTAEKWIAHLGMTAHPEGGYFVETYRAKIEGDAHQDARAASTGIYFLLRAGDVSHLHRIDADEMWHFYAGSPLTVHMIDTNGVHSTHKLGPDVSAGEVFQAVVTAGTWFGAEVCDGGNYALVGCTVAPAFEFSGFELADRKSLSQQFPIHSDLIARLT